MDAVWRNAASFAAALVVALAIAAMAPAQALATDAGCALLDSDGCIYPCDSAGGKVDTPWAGGSFYVTSEAFAPVKKLFVAPSVTGLYSKGLRVKMSGVATPQLLTVKGLVNLEEVVFMLDGGRSRVAEIGRSTFGGYSYDRPLTSLSRVDMGRIPLERIGERAFMGCTWLRAVKLPGCLGEIGGSCFEGCLKLSSLTVPKSVEKIGSYAFSGAKLRTLIVKSKKLEAENVRNSLGGSKVETVKVKVGSKKLNKRFAKKYRKVFTEANCGKKVKVK